MNKEWRGQHSQFLRCFFYNVDLRPSCQNICICILNSPGPCWTSFKPFIYPQKTICEPLYLINTDWKAKTTSRVSGASWIVILNFSPESFLRATLATSLNLGAWFLPTPQCATGNWGSSNNNKLIIFFQLIDINREWTFTFGHCPYHLISQKTRYATNITINKQMQQLNTTSVDLAKGLGLVTSLDAIVITLSCALVVLFLVDTWKFLTVMTFTFTMIKPSISEREDIANFHSWICSVGQQKCGKSKESKRYGSQHSDLPDPVPDDWHHILPHIIRLSQHVERAVSVIKPIKKNLWIYNLPNKPKI